jgi:7-cyano-7-deazaguanine synthase in queuosine biosynthesis
MTDDIDEFERQYLRGKRHLAIAFSKLYCKSETLFKCYQADSTSTGKCTECAKIEAALEESNF